jgi:hypothetical protein
MSSYTTSGTGFPPPQAPGYPVHAVPFAQPHVFRPALVRIENDHLYAPPSAAPVLEPAPGAWRNIADTAADALDEITAIAIRYGPLTGFGVRQGGEELRVWRELIEDVRLLTSTWTRTGAIAGPAPVGAAETAAMRMQFAIGREHQANGGGFVSYGRAGWGLLCTEMRQWWLLSAINAVYAGIPLRRCKHCGHWFSLAGQRSDAGFCSQRHRSGFHQRREPPALPWAEVIG